MLGQHACVGAGGCYQECRGYCSLVPCPARAPPHTPGPLPSPLYCPTVPPCTAGKAKYDPKRHALVWKLKKFAGEAEHTLTASVELIATTKEKRPWSRPPLSMSFQVGGWAGLSWAGLGLLWVGGWVGGWGGWVGLGVGCGLCECGYAGMRRRTSPLSTAS